MEEKKSDKRHDFGLQCEFMARNYLEQQGYLILESNWRCGHKEIDIIAKERDMLVIVEVKARENEDYTHAEDAVDEKKMRNLIWGDRLCHEFGTAEFVTYCRAIFVKHCNCGSNFFSRNLHFIGAVNKARIKFYRCRSSLFFNNLTAHLGISIIIKIKAFNADMFTVIKKIQS